MTRLNYKFNTTHALLKILMQNCILETTKNVLIDHKEPENIIYTMMKYGEILWATTHANNTACNEGT